MLEKILLHPPGGCQTRRSGWRQQQDDSDLVAVAVENLLQPGDAGEISENGRRGRRRCLRNRPGNRPREPERGREAQPTTSDDPIARPHWPEGFLGTACVAVFGHRALMAVRHRLPRIELLLLAGD